MVLALIPARGGSKGVPKKNLRKLAGKPLIAHSIEQAKALHWIDRVVVTTDSPEIARVARRFGAETPFLRPAALANDRTTDLPVVQHALAWLDRHEAYRPDIIVFLRPTGPLRTVNQIREGLRLLVKTKGADSVRSVNVPPQTPYKMWKLGKPFMKPLLTVPGVKEPFNAPRQSLPPVYQTNPNISVMWARTVLKKKSMTGTNVVPLVIDEPLVDIDHEVDFLIAEALLKKRRRS